MGAVKVICDTDVIIDYFDVRQSRHHATRHTLEDEIGLDNVVLSVISKMELMAGARTKGELTTINRRLARFDTLLIDPTVTERALTLLETYRLSHGLAIPDCFIAASVLTTGLQLFTYNIKDFRFISRLKLFSR